jgi:CRISPR-associated protein Cmr4
MSHRILYLLTRTPLHVGAGASVGAVDQPIQRERHTGFPIIPGSALKGVLADGDGFLEKAPDGRLKRDDKGRCVRTSSARQLFGDERTELQEAASGSISFGEGKLLAFPVRSGRGCFAWLTSPLALGRWQRDADWTGLPPLPSPAPDEASFDEAALGHKAEALFEDYSFKQHASPLPPEWVDKLSGIFTGLDNLWASHCRERIVLVSDATLSLFATTACEVSQHVRIDDETGTAADRALFNQENVPGDTLFYARLEELRPGKLALLPAPAVLQIGADATTGLGYCSTRMIDPSI